MSLQLPVRFVAEFRGVSGQWDSFTDRQTGEQRPGGKRYRFEYETPGLGLVADVEIARSSIDKAADFDIDSLKRGESVEIAGLACDGRDGMYLRCESVKRAEKGQLKAAS